MNGGSADKLRIMIKGIFFDLGGTLFHYEGANRPIGKALVKSMMALGAQSPEEIGQAYGLANREIAKKFADLDYYLHADMFRATFTRATELLSVAFDEDTYRGFAEIQHKSIVDNLELKKDCKDTLAALRGKRKYLSIVSNIDEDMLQPLVNREGLDDYLDHWTSSEAAQSCKPHRKFFEVSLEKAGLDPHDVLFVGDSPEHDVNGASSVGMRTVLIRNGNLEAPLQSGKETQTPDYVVEHLSEIVSLVD